MEEYKNSGHYKSLGIEGLEEQLAGYQMDDAQLRQQAESQYRPAYEAELEGMRQQLARQRQGYEEQLAGMDTAYDRQRRQTERAYDESAVDLSNALTRRGLGRSSLVATQGAHLENQRNQALADIDRDEAQAINAINEKIALLTDQAAQSERTLAGNYARQLENRISELKEKNRTAAVSLQLQIAALQQQGYEAYQQWLLDQRRMELEENEFAAEHPVRTGGSSGGGSKGTNTGAAKSTANAGSTASAAGGALMKLLNSVKTALSTRETAAARAAVKTGSRRLGKR